MVAELRIYATACNYGPHEAYIGFPFGCSSDPKLHADKAYDSRRCRAECRARGIKPRIARKGVDSGQRLGRHRWIVERTHAWMARLRRLAVRYERRDDIHMAFTLLGCAIVCMNQIRRFC